NPQDGASDINLTADPLTGFYFGDLAWPASAGQGHGTGDGYPGNIRFFTSVNGVESTTDSDGDGLPDLWETNGLDTAPNRRNGADLPMNTWGAKPDHKDLFLELDWMPGAAPNREEINALKTAFAVAPIDAGTNASALTNGVNAQPNPDGQPGINLWVD